MKKLLLFGLLLFAAINTQAQYTLIPDPVFEQQLISKGIDSGPIDGQVLTANINTVKNLYLSTYTTSDLTGIEDFIALETFECSFSNITSADFSSNLQLKKLIIGGSYTNNNGVNYLASLNIASNTLLEEIRISYSSITYLDFSAHQNLKILSFNRSPNLTSLNISTNWRLEELGLWETGLTTLSLVSTNSNFTDYPNLYSLNISYNNQLTNLTISNTGIRNLNVDFNENLTNTAITNNEFLSDFIFTHNAIGILPNFNNNFAVGSLVISNNLFLTKIVYENNNSMLIDTIDLSTNRYLGEVILQDIPLVESIDLSKNRQLYKVNIENSYNLKQLTIKNGNINTITNNDFIVSNTPQLTSICVDDATYASNTFTNIPTGIGFSEYCSFAPTDANLISGNITFDANGNGYDATDVPMQNIKVITTDTNDAITSFTNSQGAYETYTLANAATTTAILDIPTYFTVTPATQTSSFSNPGSTETINYSVAANTQINDVEVSIQTLAESRPGFDTKVRLTYKNIGTTVLSGNLTLDFDKNIQAYTSASVSPSNQTVNQLEWNYTNLTPFESVTIDVTFTINRPTATVNPVMGGELLEYKTNITTNTTEANMVNNEATLFDVIVNAYDPNDILAFEGTKISETQVPDDLTYRIRFQNTGTASAINVVVKNILDADLDVNTFKPISASHNHRVLLSDNNKLEFIFENIQLPDSTSNEPASHGWIFYKIKPKSTAVIGDNFDATANIYFDFNAPVITNTFNTAVEVETTIPDANFETELINKGLDRGVLDTKVFTSTINTVTNLNVASKNIADLTGIANFTALKTLDVNDNKLTNLNLSTNTALETLDASSNQITELDLNTNTVLTSLDVQSNALTSLLLRNTNNANFTVFNTTSNPNLTCIEVDNATWSTTNWTNIDASSNFVNSDAECRTLSKEIFQDSDISLLENPVKEILSISLKKQANYRLFTINGKEILKGKLSVGTNELKMNQLNTGIYLLEIKTKIGSITKKIVKQ